MQHPKLYGLAEFAAALGWDKRKMSTYIARGIMPAPYQQLASGPVWTEEQVQTYIQSQQPNGLPKQSLFVAPALSEAAREFSARLAARADYLNARQLRAHSPRRQEEIDRLREEWRVVRGIADRTEQD